MKTIMGIFVAFAFALSAGCAGGEKEFKKWKEAACACKDKACADKQDKALEALIKKMEGKRGDNDKAQKYVTDGVQCLMKLQIGGVTGGE